MEQQQQQQHQSPNDALTHGTSASPVRQLPSPAWSPYHQEVSTEEILPMLDPISPTLRSSTSPEYTLSSDSVPPSVSSIEHQRQSLNEENDLQQHDEDDDDNTTGSGDITPTGVDASSAITLDSYSSIRNSSIDEQAYDASDEYLPGETSEDITEEEVQSIHPRKRPPAFTYYYDEDDDDYEDDSTTTITTTKSYASTITNTTHQSITDMDMTSNDEEQQQQPLDEEELELFISDWFEEILCMELDPPEDLLWWCVVCERQYALPEDVVHHTREQHGFHLPTPRPVGRPPIDMYVVSTHSTQV
ncbi:predicted protein [Lichtheimia corymbifera JMRC:FSU:9682]|uniref:C2H2-type domain-containing protein n=1 Tax=Lichtheimia corymbifera JMRC:FSU:9682 TaxID=1263082 RepID=A0A068RLI5_9FUNG|nr:predicted protein [Lichtheimia corymbifera JMRC:FSU:9682]